MGTRTPVPGTQPSESDDVYEHSDAFARAVANVPDADIDALQKIVAARECDCGGVMPTRLNLAAGVVQSRRANRICSKCCNNDRRALEVCEACGLDYYCSRACQQSDQERHKLRCCKKDGPLDKGPMGIAIVHIDPPVQVHNAATWEEWVIAFVAFFVISLVVLFVIGKVDEPQFGPPSFARLLVAMVGVTFGFAFVHVFDVRLLPGARE